MGPLIPLFWTYGDVCPGFQSQARFLTCVRCHRRAVDSSGSPPVPHLLTSSRSPLYLCGYYLCFNNNLVEHIYVQMHLCILSFTPNTRFYMSCADRWEPEPEHGSVDPTVPFLASYTVLCNRTNVQSCNVLIFLGGRSRLRPGSQSTWFLVQGEFSRQKLHVSIRVRFRIEVKAFRNIQLRLGTNVLCIRVGLNPSFRYMEIHV